MKSCHTVIYHIGVIDSYAHNEVTSGEVRGGGETWASANSARAGRGNLKVGHAQIRFISGGTKRYQFQ